MKARRLPISSSPADSRDVSTCVVSPRLASTKSTHRGNESTLLQPSDSPSSLSKQVTEIDQSYVSNHSAEALPLDTSSDLNHEGHGQLDHENHDVLEAIVAGRLLKVKVRIESPRSHQPSLRDSVVGFDGNKFYCQVCGGFGEIVCCDGCPRVFHPDCIAPAHPSRRALDRDEDPWFCPECLEKPEGVNASFRASEMAPSLAKSVHSVSSPQGVDPTAVSTRTRACDDAHDGSPHRGDDIFESKTFELSRGASDKRKRSALAEGVEKPSKSKPKAKKRRTLSPSPPGPAVSPLTTPISRLVAEAESPSLTKSDLGLAHATPAFYFYLTENRWKIERVLTRNHRYFNRLPKGESRNALVAKEAALWWTKLRPADHRRYMNMSMRDFESQIIEWKEDKNLKDMGIGDLSDGSSPPLDAEDDMKFLRDKHQKRFQSNSVGSKPFNPEIDQYYNRVLLDLLHDARFHPLPLFDVERTDEDMILDDHYVKLTIPHFEVHGPISTSVGDECLGCTRGWLHFCPVLQRRVPAVEHRAKLQPPASSLLGCRTGLALRPRFEVPSGEVPTKSELFQWAPSPEIMELTCLSVLPCCTLDHPNARVDEITRFIEQTMAMKVPEPERPLLSGKTPSRDPPQLNSHAQVYKCGRCRTIIYNATGCVQCRRAQLVINTTKRTGAAPDGGPRTRDLVVRAAMLGRVTVKDGMEEKQTPGDAAVSTAILRIRWTPNAILPPERSLVPRGSDLLESQESREQWHTHLRDVDKNEGARELDEVSDSSQDSPSSMINHSFSGNPDVEPSTVVGSGSGDFDELFKRALLIACCGIFLAVRRRDPLLLFAEPANAEGYSSIVQNPIDLGTIKHDLLNGKYTSLDSFVSDVTLVCENAITFNPTGSIYSKTARHLLSIIGSMHEKAREWMSAVTNGFLANQDGYCGCSSNAVASETFESLRLAWPETVSMLESGDWLVSEVQSDFMRTKENERAYYGSVAVRRVAAAAEAALAPYTDSRGSHSAVPLRSSTDDDDLRTVIDSRVSGLVKPLQLKDVSTWREEGVVRLLRKVQSRRLDRRFASENGCSRCDSVKILVKASELEQAHPGRGKRKGEGDMLRVEASRLCLTTGMGSASTCERVEARRSKGSSELSITDACTSVRGSRIHGWGLFADQKFSKGDLVAEYLGEYVTNPVADAREKIYQKHRIQDYQFRLDDALVVDATLRGCDGRYINHNCNPNCVSRIIAGSPTSPDEKRVVFIALRDIDINEEITYDYQFPLEMNLQHRIPCNCQADICRGFMNWDIPEKGSNRALLIQKRGANMRDRIRRLGRPLKRDEGTVE